MTFLRVEGRETEKGRGGEGAGEGGIAGLMVSLGLQFSCRRFRDSQQIGPDSYTSFIIIIPCSLRMRVRPGEEEREKERKEKLVS